MSVLHNNVELRLGTRGTHPEPLLVREHSTRQGGGVCGNAIRRIALAWSHSSGSGTGVALHPVAFTIAPTHGYAALMADRRCTRGLCAGSTGFVPCYGLCSLWRGRVESRRVCDIGGEWRRLHVLWWQRGLLVRTPLPWCPVPWCCVLSRSDHLLCGPTAPSSLRISWSSAPPRCTPSFASWA